MSFWLYRPAEMADDPSFTARDVTIIIPTVDPGNSMFTDCLKSVLRNGPSRMIIVTAGNALLAETVAIVADVRREVSA